MLGFFPAPYPDEILYSIMARYKVRGGIISSKANIEDLFGTNTNRAVVDLPSNLLSFIQNLPIGSQFTAEYFIYNHTLFPFYEKFLPLDRVKLVMDAMLFNGGKSIYAQSGILASSVKNPKFLRFCPTCFQDDVIKFGEAYWHRIHQITGVLICSIHGVLLFDSKAMIHDENPHTYHACLEELCQVKPQPVNFSLETIEKLYSLSKDIDWLLNSRIGPKEINWYRERYLLLLQERNFATPKGRVFQEELMNDFLKFYSGEFLKAVQGEIEIGENSWLRGIVRKHRKVFHPIRHLLLIRYLVGKPQEFFSTCCSYHPFGEGPWPCLNIITDHYRQTTINSIETVWSRNARNPVGIFKCDFCGFIYSRQGPDCCVNDKYRIDKVKSFGDTWKKKLIELSSNSKLSLREIARNLNVDPKTVKKYREELSNSRIEEKKNVKEYNTTELGDDKRIAWISLQSGNPFASKTFLRKLNPSIYTWLYRNDRGWLNLNSPIVKGNNRIKERVDWNERDKEILRKAQIEVKKIINYRSKPERITINKIGKRIEGVALIQKHLNKMPETKEFLESVVESVEDFQIRRIQWSVKQLKLGGEELKEWKIVRMAGLKAGYSNRIQLAIHEEIDSWLKNISWRESVIT